MVFATWIEFVEPNMLRYKIKNVSAIRRELSYNTYRK